MHPVLERVKQQGLQRHSPALRHENMRTYTQDNIQADKEGI